MSSRSSPNDVHACQFIILKGKFFMDNFVISPFPAETPIGMAYVPFQQWETPYDERMAISRGTVFPSLDLPFIGEEAVPRER